MKNQHGVEREEIILGTWAAVRDVRYFHPVVACNGMFFTLQLDGDIKQQVHFDDILAIRKPQEIGRERRYAQA